MAFPFSSLFPPRSLLLRCLPTTFPRRLPIESGSPSPQEQHQVMKSSSVKNVVVCLLLFDVFLLLIHFAYIVTVYSGPYNSGNFCLLSFPGEGLSITGASGDSSAGSAAFVHVIDGSAATSPALWTAREWCKAVDYYSAIFQDLLVEGFLTLTAKIHFLLICLT